MPDRSRRPAQRATGVAGAEARLRAHALAKPGATEHFPWGERAIKVNGKVFLFMSAGDDELSLSTKLPRSAPVALLLPFATPTGYGLGKAGWVSARFAPAKLAALARQNEIDTAAPAAPKPIASANAPAARKPAARKPAAPAARKPAAPAARKPAAPAARKPAAPAARKPTALSDAQRPRKPATRKARAARPKR